MNNAQTAIWVGIDGANGVTVEQCGTWATMVNGKPQYFAWYEFFGDQTPSSQNPNPNPQGPDYHDQPIPGFAVNAGDTISAEVSLVAGTNKTFFFQMTDTPKGGGAVESFSKVQTMTYVVPIRASAEFIVENPNNGSQPLGTFSQVNFTGAWATVGSTTGSINSFSLPELWNMVSSSGNAYGSNPPVSSAVLGFNEPTSGHSSSSFTVTDGIAPMSSGSGSASHGSVRPAQSADVSDASIDVGPSVEGLKNSLLRAPFLMDHHS